MNYIILEILVKFDLFAVRSQNREEAHTVCEEGEEGDLTFERGVEDFTLACGTGCGSITTTLWLKDRLPDGKLTLNNRGGTLKVAISGKPEVESLYLEGPTQITEIFELDI